MTIRIDGMTCQNCVKHVMKAIETVVGVGNVTVNLEKGEAVINAPGAVIEDIKAAVAEEGYEVVDIII